MKPLKQIYDLDRNESKIIKIHTKHLAEIKVKMNFDTTNQITRQDTINLQSTIKPRKY